MSNANSLCPVSWELGQALMPAHFKTQDTVMRTEAEVRFALQTRPPWGLAALEWSLSERELTISRLRLVLEDGTLIDVPGNANKLTLPLREFKGETISVYCILEKDAHRIETEHRDDEGGLVKRAQLQLRLSTAPATGDARGFRLAHFRAVESEPDGGAAKSTGAWAWHGSYIPPLLRIDALSDFHHGLSLWCSQQLVKWEKLLHARCFDQCIEIGKRVEAQLYLRRAYGLRWWFEHALFVAKSPAQVQSGLGLSLALRAHPFDVFERLVELHLDIYAFRGNPVEQVASGGPALARYDHRDLARSFETLQQAIDKALSEPRARSSEIPFREGEPNIMVCDLPKGLSASADVYLLVQLEGPEPVMVGQSPGALDPRLAGIRLASPHELSEVEQLSTTGIRLERVRLVPFPHNFDARVIQFYRFMPGEDWTAAYQAGQVAYTRHPAVVESFLFCVDGSK